MKRRTAPFTLIELLVVIAIIAILAGILLPTINIAIRKANVAKARSEMSSLINAIAMYQSEYDVMPFTYQAASNSRLLPDADYDVLISFLSQTGTAANMSQGNARRLRILSVKNPGEFNDPWGRRYRIVYDSNYNGTVDVNDPAQTPGLVHTETTIPRSVLVYSVGPDGATNATAANNQNRDNIYSVDTIWANGQGHVTQ